MVYLSIVTYVQKCYLEGLTESRNASVTDTFLPLDVGS